MKTIVRLTQTNKSNKVSFESYKVFSLGENDDYTVLAKDIADFCKDIEELVEKNHKVGYNTLDLKIKKSLPLQLTIVSDEDLPVSLSFRNFGKFLQGVARKPLEAFLKNNINFVYKWSYANVDNASTEFETLRKVS